MPPALKVDWGAARALYVAGLDYDTICKRLNIPYDAIKQRSSRGEWNKMREEAKNYLKTQPGTKEDSLSPSVTKALVSTFQGWKESAINEVAQAGAKVAESLRKQVESDPAYEAQAKAFAQFEPASRVLKPFLGLNDGQQVQVGVQVNMLTEIPTMDEFTLPKDDSERE